MNITLPANTVPPHNGYTEALRLNKADLERNVSAATSALRETVQLQQQAQIGLMDRIALLEAQLKDSQQETARAKADLQAEKVASAAIARQNTSRQEELAQLRPSDAILRKMVATVAALNRIQPEAWLDWNHVYSHHVFDASDINYYTTLQRERKESNFARTGTYIPTPEHWDPILADLKRARDLIASRDQQRR